MIDILCFVAIVVLAIAYDLTVRRKPPVKINHIFRNLRR